MSIAERIANALLRHVLDLVNTEGIMAEIERQANMWILSDVDGTL